jgi:hypothetical protein
MEPQQQGRLERLVAARSSLDQRSQVGSLDSTLRGMYASCIRAWFERHGQASPWLVSNPDARIVPDVPS